MKQKALSGLSDSKMLYGYSSSFTHRLFLQMNEWINKKRRAEDILLSYFHAQKRPQSSHSTLKWLSKPGKLQIISVKHWEEPNYFLHGPPEKMDLAPISDRQGKRQELMARMDWAECSHSTAAESLTTSVTILSADSCHRTADRYWRIHFISGECLLTDHLLNLSHFFFFFFFFLVLPLPITAASQWNHVRCGFTLVTPSNNEEISHDTVRGRRWREED